MPQQVVKGDEKEKFFRDVNVEIYVRHYFSDIPLLADIAYCESRFRQYNKIGNPLRGEVNKSDIGVMQVNEYYHGKTSNRLGYDIYTLNGNLTYARYLYEREGARPWMSSSPCWAKFGQSDIA
ncbi:MAG: hypothetical protein KAR00_00845, partial [Candidatus Pacebacteria bacterium]|nr:hypothetical protein [Candidatus Paceibacterota bacterium]